MNKSVEVINTITHSNALADKIQAVTTELQSLAGMRVLFPTRSAK